MGAEDKCICYSDAGSVHQGVGSGRTLVKKMSTRKAKDWCLERQSKAEERFG